MADEGLNLGASMNHRIHLLIPAYNEVENLPHLFAGLLPALQELDRPWDLLFVDDGSTDATVAHIKDQARGYPISVLSHRKNLGPGAAFTTGFRALLNTSADHEAIITLEADGTSDVTLLEPLLARYDLGVDVVLASVYHPDGGLKHTPFHRRALSSAANALLRTLFHMPELYTFSSFYRVYRTGLLREAMALYGLRLIEEPGFAAVVELLIRLNRMGARIEEVPMVLDSSHRIGASRMRVGKTIRAYFRMMARQELELTSIQDLIGLMKDT